MLWLIPPNVIICWPLIYTRLMNETNMSRYWPLYHFYYDSEEENVDLHVQATLGLKPN